MSNLNYTSQTGSNDFGFSGDGSYGLQLQGNLYSYGGAQTVTYTASVSGVLNYNIYITDMMFEGASAYVQVNGVTLGGIMTLSGTSSYSGSVSISSGQTVYFWFDPGSGTSHMSYLASYGMYIAVVHSEFATGGSKLSGDSIVSYQSNETAAGGLSLSGDSMIGYRYDETTAGGLTLSGDSMVSYLYEETAAGGLSLSGDAIFNSQYNETAAGGLSLSGDAMVSNLYDETATGGLSLSGDAIFNYQYNETAAGGLSLSGDAMVSNLYDETATGGLSLSGDSMVGYRYDETATGGLTLSGDAMVLYLYDETAIGGLSLSGDAIFNSQYNEIATGGLSLSGDSMIGYRYDETATGGLSLSGDSMIGYRYDETATGGLILSGDSIFNSQYNEIATGGLSLSGDAIFNSQYNETTAGGLSLSGDAIVNRYNEIATGGSKVSGESIVISKKNFNTVSTGGILVFGDLTINYEEIATGGSKISGNSIVSSKITFKEKASGGLSSSGTGDVYQIYYSVASGGISVAGNHRINIYYYPDGKMVFSGISESVVRNFFDLNIRYQIYNEFTKDITISYNVGELPFSYYRIEGCCRATADSTSGVICEFVPLQTNDPKCSGALGKQKYFQNILARSVKEVCSILTASNWDWTVCSIGRFTRPPYSFQDGYNTQCNVVEEQLEFCTIPECLAVCIHSKATERFAYSFIAYQKLNKFYTSSGNVILHGRSASSLTVPPNVYQGTGLITVSENVDFKYLVFNEIAEGEIFIDGYYDLHSSYFKFDSDGSVFVGGASSVTSTQYNYEVVLGIVTLENVVDAELKFFASFDVSSISVYGSAEYPFVYYPSGLGFSGNGIEVFNISETSRLSGLSQVSYGTMVISGNSKIVSPYYSFESVDSIVVAGTAKDRRNSYLYSPDGLTTTISGEAYSSALDDGNFQYVSDGSVNLFSSIDSYVAIHRYVSEDTDIFVSGNSGTGGSWKGVGEEVFGYGMTSLQLYIPNPIENVTGITYSENATVALTACENCGTIASFLYLKSNLFDSTYLKSLLVLNDFTIPEEFVLYYSAKLKSWIGTVHYKGVDNKNTNSPIDISINYEFSCINSLGGEELGSNYLKFNLMIRVKDITTKKETKTKVLVLFPAETTCYYVNSNDFDMSFSVSTIGKYVVVPFNVLVDYLIISDDLGLFTNSYWDTNLFEVSISDSGKTLTSSKYALPINTGVENP